MSKENYPFEHDAMVNAFIDKLVECIRDQLIESCPPSDMFFALEELHPDYTSDTTENEIGNFEKFIEWLELEQIAVARKSGRKLIYKVDGVQVSAPWYEVRVYANADLERLRDGVRSPLPKQKEVARLFSIHADGTIWAENTQLALNPDNLPYLILRACIEDTAGDSTLITYEVLEQAITQHKPDWKDRSSTDNYKSIRDAVNEDLFAKACKYSFPKDHNGTEVLTLVSGQGYQFFNPVLE